MKSENKNTSILDIVRIYLFNMNLLNVGSKVRQKGKFKQVSFALEMFFKTNQCLKCAFPPKSHILIYKKIKIKVVSFG